MDITDGNSETWSSVVAALGLADAQLIGQSVHSAARRTYRVGDRCVKVRLVVPEGVQRRQDLGGEYELLAAARGIPGIPRALGYEQGEGYEVLTMQAMPGEPFGLRPLSWPRYLAALTRLKVILIALAWRGISHGDVTPGNVLVTPAGYVALIDFDQATRGSRWASLRRSLFGEPGQSTGSLWGLFNQDMRMRLPARAKTWVRRLVPATRAPRPAVPPLPVLAPDADEATRRMLRAWQMARAAFASSPEEGLAYYTVEFGGVTFPGERPWAERWPVLRDAVRPRERRLLELGCNMGLLSSFSMQEGAAAALGVDHDPAIIEAAREVAAAYGVTPSFETVDFDAPGPWEERLLAFRPDVVTCLNVTHWLRDPARMFAFLGRVPEVIYEGHDPYEIEVQHLRAAGLSHVELLGVSERGRAVLRATR